MPLFEHRTEIVYTVPGIPESPASASTRQHAPGCAERLGQELIGDRMEFLQRLLRKDKSNRPEDYGRLFVRWKKGGNEYGPMNFHDLLTRRWSGPPLEGRFEAESTWSSYKRFLKLLDRLTASEEQVETLSKNGALAPGATPPRYKDAIDQINELMEQEKADKAKLLATPHMRKKMDALGIQYAIDVNRAEAKALVKEHEEREALKEVIRDLGTFGVTLSMRMVRDVQIQPARAQGLNASLGELADVLEEAKLLDVLPDPVEIPSQDVLEQLCQRYINALSEADGIESDLEERELFIGDDEYKVVGTLPKKGMLCIKQAAFKESLDGTWNAEQRTLPLLAEYMPKVRVKKVLD